MLLFCKVCSCEVASGKERKLAIWNCNFYIFFSYLILRGSKNWINIEINWLKDKYSREKMRYLVVQRFEEDFSNSSWILVLLLLLLLLLFNEFRSKVWRKTIFKKNMRNVWTIISGKYWILPQKTTLHFLKFYFKLRFFFCKFHRIRHHFRYFSTKRCTTWYAPHPHPSSHICPSMDRAPLLVVRVNSPCYVQNESLK